MILISKPTDIEINENYEILEDFGFALLARDLKTIQLLLSDNGNFMNKPKNQFLGFINQWFYSLPNESETEYYIYKGVTLDNVPGSYTYEIRTKKINDKEHSFKEKTNTNRLGEELKFNETLFRFSAIVKNRKIIYLFEPKIYIKFEKVIELIELN